MDARVDWMQIPETGVTSYIDDMPGSLTQGTLVIDGSESGTFRSQQCFANDDARAIIIDPMNPPASLTTPQSGFFVEVMLP